MNVILYKGLKEYYNTWKFKHPNTNDCIRVFEKVSGLELDWYKEYFVYTTHTIDYGVKEVKKSKTSKKGSTIVLEKVGAMPMPLDVEIETTNGKKYYFNIPMRIMRGSKLEQMKNKDWTLAPDWPWTNERVHPVFPCYMGRESHFFVRVQCLFRT